MARCFVRVVVAVVGMRSEDLAFFGFEVDAAAGGGQHLWWVFLMFPGVFHFALPTSHVVEHGGKMAILPLPLMRRQSHDICNYDKPVLGTVNKPP